MAKKYHFVKDVLTSKYDYNEGDVYTSSEHDFAIFKSLEYIPKFEYPSMVFEVDILDGDIAPDYYIGELYSDKIKLVRNITEEEVDKYFEENAEKILKSKIVNKRICLASRGICLDKLVHDPAGLVRATVADKGYGLEELIYDSDNFVRINVAEQGYGLDKLVDDSDECVRCAVVRQGYMLDKLVEDISYVVRREIATVGPKRYLKQLVNDPNPEVRSMVAYRGYRLDVFKDDPDPEVKMEVINKGKYLSHLLQDRDPEVRLEAVRYVLRTAVDDPSIAKSVKDFVHIINWDNIK